MKRINLTIVLSLIFVFLFYLALWIEGFIAVYLILFTVIIGLTLLVSTIRELIVKKNFFYFGIGIIALCLVFFRPIEFIVESLKSPIIVQGHCEHAVSGLSINLRKDQTFEYNSGAFLKKEMYVGKYSIKGDMLLLNFDEPHPKGLPDILIYKNGSLVEEGKAEHNHNFKLVINSVWK